MRVPRCYGTILQIFVMKIKGVFRILGAVRNLADLKVHIDHTAPLNRRIPELDQLLFEIQEI